MSIAVRTSDKGKLFGSVTVEDIAAAVKKAGGPSLDKTAIELPKRHVKNTGSYAVNVKLHGDIAATVNFEVVAA